MSENFKVGDVVKLKSGSPKMTVTLVGDSNGQPTVWVSWFDDKDQPAKNTYPPDSLQKA